MYVVRRSRRQGVARLLLQQIESRAREFNFHAMRFATGTRQPEAIGFYEDAGYMRIKSYGEHVHDPYAVCYEKSLIGRPHGAQHRTQSADSER